MQSVNNEELPENPREHSNFLLTACFWYTIPTFIKGRKDTLGANDLYKVLKEHKSDTLGNQLGILWDQDMKTSKGKPSLIRVLLRKHGWYFGLLGLVLVLMEVVLRGLQPLLLRSLIYKYSQDSSSKTDGNIYAGALILSSSLGSIITHPYMFAVCHVCFKIRVGLGSLVYRKALRLSKASLNDTTAGHVVNLISNDLGQLDSIIYHGHYLWVGPLQMFLITFVMYQEIGFPAVLGVAFMLLFIPINLYVGKISARLRIKSVQCTDERVRLMREIITGIQAIKMYAWELPFERIVSYIRKKEVDVNRRRDFITVLHFSLSVFVSRASTFISLVGYAMIAQVLTSEVAFLIIAYYNILRETMSIFFAMGITQTAEYWVSLKRVQAFLQLEEMDQITAVEDPEENEVEGEETTLLSSTPHTKLVPRPLGAELYVYGLTAKWDPKSPECTLNEVSLQIKSGTLLAVVGLTGSGKSSLLQAILGELPVLSGEIKKRGSISYAAQEPWLFSGTVRQNILFGQPMDHQRYWKVVKDCALERDFDLLPFKDQTIVGDRGASLSGGQKARISLARAVYREASIYLLDDPLSAVDTHVARHIFEKCIRGYLRDRIVILVTHQLQFIQQCDEVMVLDKGQAVAAGSFESLRNSGVDFTILLKQAESDGTEKKSEEVPEGPSPLKMQRNQSERSLKSLGDLNSDEKSNKQEKGQEYQASGKVGLDVYLKYMRAGGGVTAFSLMLIAWAIFQGLSSMIDLFLTHWVNHNKGENSMEASEGKEYQTLIWLQDMGWSLDPKHFEILVYFLIVVLTNVAYLIAIMMLFRCTIAASVRMHNSMYRGISRASMYFFNTNPSGQILNRFSKDLVQIGEVLPRALQDFIKSFFALMGVATIIAVVNPILLIPTIVLGFLFYQVRVFYLKTSRDLKRIEAIARSPVYSHVTASLSGLSTIRAFESRHLLEQEFDSYQDMHSSAHFMLLSCSRAFANWLDFFCGIYTAIVTISFSFFPPENGALVGLAITQAMSLVAYVQWGLRQSAEVENIMTAVERVVEYEEIEPEGDLEALDDKKPPKSWPEEGNIVFDELSLRYVPDPKAENVLKALSFEIKPQEKVGIVGRTGAGKSSLINALFCLSYNDGIILIDKRDTDGMGLHDLRRKISIIPQEPVLFSGSIRYNLDPFEEYSDEKLWRSLEEVKLKEVVADLPCGLQSKIADGGTNFSVGQRQLVCLARAILRENRILVMDEATSNVDPQTDGLIQATIRNKFKKCTVLTIAHRLHTIMDSDKVLVMDAGRVLEFGTPYELLTEADSKVFHGMVKQTGQVTYDALLKIAQRVRSF
ncbi:probable multidrug resistance-associated protein lethal(2)03659 [Drosophila bipectinata]|uniref:probable multidrug resistance-associated protein lethal(2)03659 n=1 Tax=Drosophila bipectinata TaxID=42026 RepID=UPI001C8A2AA9|nr:probable multidrug resistance-associated protein lethal(2)03659 [Drosophila bipectinata]